MMIDRNHRSSALPMGTKRRTGFIAAVCRIMLPFLFILLSHVAYGQSDKISVTGVVTDTAGQPVVGALVIEVGTANAILTDANGVYNIDPNRGASLRFQSFGYMQTEVEIGSRTRIDVVMQEDTSEIEQVVVVGYGTMKRKDLTGAIASMNAEKIAAVPVQDVRSALQGNIPGVLVSQSSWTPGSTPSVLIRGKRSINAGNDPLYVVDGIPMTGGFDQFSPGDIQSIDVLKDASATAIYGSRGSGGVVMITTKKGREGSPQIEYHGVFGLETIARKNELMNGAEFADYIRESWRGAGKYSSLTPDRTLDYTVAYAVFGGNASLDSAPMDAYAWESIAMAYDAQGNYDPSKVRSMYWEKEVERTGVVHDHSVNIRGGTSRGNYMVSGNYRQQNGIYKDQDYKRYNIRANLEQEIRSWLKVGANQQYSNSVQNRGANLHNNWRVNPLGRMWDDEGNLTEATVGVDTQYWNPLQFLVDGAIVNPRTVDRFMGNYFVEIKLPVDGLRFLSNAGIDFISTKDYSFNSALARKTTDNSASNNTAQRKMFTVENMFFYDKTFGNHNLGVTLMQSVQRDKNNSNGISTQGLPSDQLLWYNMGAGLKNNSQSSSFSQWSMASLMGRVNYNFKNRYYLTASLRYDGSSRLAEGHKWVPFASVSGAWRISDEPFMQNATFFDNLKLRIGYGSVANTSIDPYKTKGVLTQIAYNFGTNNVFGYAPNELPNKELGWELTNSWNVGLDFSILDNRISGTVDAYVANTADLLLNRNLPVVTGFASVLTNIGNTRNSGVEVALNTVNIQRKNFTWTTDWMVAYNNEEIVELYNGKVDDIGSSWFIGQPINVYYDYKKVGIWQNTPGDLAEMAEFNKNGHTFKPGQIRLDDLNGDHKIDANNDRSIIGHERPDVTFSLVNTLSYRNFDFSILLYGIAGGMLRNELRYNHQPSRNNNVKYDYWTANNPTNAYPQPDQTVENINYESSLYLEKSDFLRIKSVTLGYTLPERISRAATVSRCRVYLQAINPYLWTGYTGVDPEGARGYTAPSLSTWTVGLNINF